MPTQKLTAEVIAAAIEGFEAQKRRIDEQIAGLRQMLAGGRTEPVAAPATPKRKRKMSAAGRKAISEASKKRWAAFHDAKETEKAAVAKKAVRKEAAKKAVKRAPVKLTKKTAAKKLQKKKKATKVPEAAAGVAAPVAGQ